MPTRRRPAVLGHLHPQDLYNAGTTAAHIMSSLRGMNLFGAGAGGAAPALKRARKARGPHTRRYGRGAHGALGQSNMWRVRGSTTTRRLHKYPKAVVAAKRAGMQGALAITHEMHSELRTKAGGQGVVTVIAERLLPTADYTGALCNSVNREDTTSGIVDTNVGATPAYAYNVIPAFANATADSVTDTVINHRQDWTMFTNGSWRDGYCYTNGNFTFAGAGTLVTGYNTPVAYGSATGYPSGWNAFTGISQPSNVTGGTDALATHPIGVGGSGGVRSNDSQLGNYYHLNESISWKFTNNSAVPVHVTMYECILVRDVPTKIMPSLNEAAGVASGLVKWGGLPCPLELWRQSRFTANEPQVFGHEGASGLGASVPVDAPLEGRGVCSAQLGRDPTTSASEGGTTTRDIDGANVTPDRAHLLHTWYKLVPHTRTIPPGASTTITVAVHFNRRIPGAWWNNFYGIGGLTRTFFMCTRPDFVTGVTGIDEAGGVASSANRRRIMAPTDLMVSWTKRKTVAKRLTRVRAALYVRAALPEIDDAVMRNPYTDKPVEVDVALNGNGEADANATGGAGDGMDL